MSYSVLSFLNSVKCIDLRVKYMMIVTMVSGNKIENVLPKESSKEILQRLRAKYCSALMLSEINHESLKNMVTTSKHYKECEKNMDINVENMIVNFKRS